MFWVNAPTDILAERFILLIGNVALRAKAISILCLDRDLASNEQFMQAITKEFAYSLE